MIQAFLRGRNRDEGGCPLHYSLQEDTYSCALFDGTLHDIFVTRRNWRSSPCLSLVCERTKTARQNCGMQGASVCGGRGTKSKRHKRCLAEAHIEAENHPESRQARMIQRDVDHRFTVRHGSLDMMYVGCQHTRTRNCAAIPCLTDALQISHWQFVIDESAKLLLPPNLVKAGCALETSKHGSTTSKMLTMYYWCPEHSKTRACPDSNSRRSSNSHQSFGTPSMSSHFTATLARDTMTLARTPMRELFPCLLHCLLPTCRQIYAEAGGVYFSQSVLF